TVCFRVAPVEMMVVDERAIENDSAMRFQGAGQSVRSVGRRAAVAGWAKLAFRVCFDGEPGEVRNQSVDFVDFFLPPCFDAGIERVEGIKMIDCLRAGDVD